MKNRFFYNLFLIALIILCAALIYSVAVENKSDIDGGVNNPGLNGDVINPDINDDVNEPEEPHTLSFTIIDYDGEEIEYSIPATDITWAEFLNEESYSSFVSDQLDEQTFWFNHEDKLLYGGEVVFNDKDFNEQTLISDLIESKIYYVDVLIPYYMENSELSLYLGTACVYGSTFEDICKKNSDYVLVDDHIEYTYEENTYIICYDETEDYVSPLEVIPKRAVFYLLLLENFEEENTSPFKNFSLRCGSFGFNGDTLTTFNQTIMTSDEPFEYGTLTLLVQYEGADAGMILGVRDGGLDEFWEEDIVEYYYYYIAKDGNLYFVHISNGEWEFLNKLEIENLTVSDVYTLQVEVYQDSDGGEVIDLYFNGNQIFKYYGESSCFSGTWGIRTYNRTNFLNYEIFTSLTIDFLANSGGFSLEDETIITNNTPTLLSMTGRSFPLYSYTADVRPVGNYDAGIIFGLDSNSETFWEDNDVSYYFLFLGSDGFLGLGRVDATNPDEPWVMLDHKTIENFDRTQIYNIRADVVYDEEEGCLTIDCYLNENLMFTSQDYDQLTGRGFGVRSGGTSEFSNIEYRYY